MKTIGITGGVGAGKSTVLDYLESKYNAKIYKADDIAHQLEAKGEACYNILVKHFGEIILAADGQLDAKKFASIIFNDKVELDFVNKTIHPAVKKYVLNKIEEDRKSGVEYFVLEAALLIEDGYLEILDEIWYVHADSAVRRNRLKESRGYSDEKIDSIMTKQLDEAQYRSLCKYTIDNSGTEQETQKSIDLILI